MRAEPDARPADRTRAAVIWATAGILLILGLAVFIVAVVVPLRQTHEAVRACMAGQIDGYEVVARLGGEERAAHQLATYLRLPKWMKAYRRGPALLLGMIGPKARESVPALVEALGDSDVDVRAAAASALGQIGSEARDAVPPLVKAVEDEDSSVRQDAIWALGEMGQEASEAVPALVEALGDAKTGVRWSAARSLGRIGPAAKETVPALEKLLNDPDMQIRAAAAEALEKIRGKE